MKYNYNKCRGIIIHTLRGLQTVIIQLQKTVEEHIKYNYKKL